MATAAPSPTRTEARPIPDGLGPVLLYGVPWSLYERMVEEIAHRHARLTFDRGTLQIMSPSPEHESESHSLDHLILILAEELDLPVAAFGSMTHKRAEHEQGMEPDECYYFNHLDRVIGMRRFHAAVDPVPDLAVEVEVTHSILDRIAIYAALGIAEVWRFDGRALRVLLLSPEGTYTLADRSPRFPQFAPEELAGWILRTGEVDHIRWRRELRAWVRQRIDAGR